MMFQYLWPQKDICDNCNNMRNGAMQYISDEPVYFVCEVCNPVARRKAVKCTFAFARKDHRLTEESENSL